ncbi:MAG: thiamine pyrophosphate-dependent dehydrogenase E1 component subunit alpha [Gaiellales bacterium]|nr:thiamine pyrophosphate-dependent dehydrogenase E1 component subunit alpha [Gaiellales bacterium]
MEAGNVARDPVPIEPKMLLELYRRMVLVRMAETIHKEMLDRQEFYLMGHFGTGQEAVGIGMTAALLPTDYLFATHRGIAEFVGKGMSQEDIWAEYYCRSVGPAKGKGGLHLSDYKVGLVGLVGSLGADYSIAVGAALSSKIQKDGRVTLYSFGEGTSSQSDFGSTLNAAALWKLPLVFGMANNQWCEFAHYSDHVATGDVAPRAEGYGIPWSIADGQDVAAAYAATQEAVDRARRGEGPSFVEFKTYRAGPHFSGEPGAYMAEEDLCRWRERDPLLVAEQRLLAEGVATRDEMDKIAEAARAEVTSAVERARSLPDVTYEEMISGVYAGEVK